MGLQKLVKQIERTPIEEWPKDLASYWGELERLQGEWWRQTKPLPKSELRALALAGATQVYALEAELLTLKLEIAKRDGIRSARGKAAQPPEVAEFREWVHQEWLLARDPKRPRATTEFASRMLARRGAPVTDTKTVQRWCREWEAENERESDHLTISPSKRPSNSIFYQLHLVPPELRASCDPEDL